MNDLEEIRTKLIELYEGGNPENKTLMSRELLDSELYLASIPFLSSKTHLMFQYSGVDNWAEEKKANPNGVVEEDMVCQECGEDPDDPHIINLKKCQHIFCRSCISDNIDGQLEESVS